MVPKDCELNIFQSYIDNPREPLGARALDASSKQCLILGLRQPTRSGTNGCGATSENCRGAQPLPEQSPHPGDAISAVSNEEWRRPSRAGYEWHENALGCSEGFSSPSQ